VNNIKMDYREMGWDGMDWIDLAQNRGQLRALVNTVMNLHTRSTRRHIPEDGILQVVFCSCFPSHN
jgi:hypothetical protein